MSLAFHAAAVGSSARHMTLCPDVVHMQGFRFTTLLSCDVLSALRYLMNVLRFSSPTGHWIFQNLDSLNMTLITLRSLHDGTT